MSIPHYNLISKLLAGISVVALAFSIYALAVVRTPQWNPLGEYPDQIAKLVKPGFIHVTATKCAKVSVQVRGSFSFQRLTPTPGIFVLAGNGQSLKPKGCVDLTFDNLTPEEVKRIVRLDGPSTWIITGTETPFDGTGKQGVPRSWRTNSFTLTVEDL
jgi:hypothetical protein